MKRLSTMDMIRLGVLLVIGIPILVFALKITKALNRQWDATNTQIQYWEEKGFKTDTIHVEIDYDKLPKPEFKYEVPPARVYYYKDSTVNNSKIILNDSLLQVIDSLKNEVTSIRLAYLKIYPRAFKFLYGYFSKDTINFDLLGIDGNIQTISYGVNYDRFKYQWTNEEFRATPIKSKPGLSTALYLYGGYEAIWNSPTLGADYSIYHRGWRLQANSYLTIKREPLFNAQLNLGYKIR